MTGAGATPIDVLIVDDSAVVREVLTKVLSEAGGMRVTVAADPVIAQEKMARQRPHVIVLDLKMPRVDGLTFLRNVMAADPIPVVVCSGLAQRGAEAAFLALEAGAVDVIAKPRLGLQGFLHQSAQTLVDTVRAAAGAKVWPRHTWPGRRGRGEAAGEVEVGPGRPRRLPLTTDKVVAIGASTGGTEALRQMLSQLPPDAPGLVIVQHMPAGFTRAFAGRLDRLCHIEVKEAEPGDRVRSGRALLAPGDRHVALVRDGRLYALRLSDGPLVSGHRPSVDVLFQSVAETAGRNAVGVIMTGMGADGAKGLLAMRRAGALTMAQDEASCVVFGMPREAIQLGAVHDVLPLAEIASAILERSGSADAADRR